MICLNGYNLLMRIIYLNELLWNLKYFPDFFFSFPDFFTINSVWQWNLLLEVWSERLWTIYLKKLEKNVKTQDSPSPYFHFRDSFQLALRGDAGDNYELVRGKMVRRQTEPLESYCTVSFCSFFSSYIW